MYALYRETDAATAVEYSAFCRLSGDGDPQLVAIGANYLRIFRLNPHVPTRAPDWTQTTKLECLINISLLTPVRSLAVVRIPRFGAGDCLLLGTDEAKLSILAFDQAAYCLRTVSMHCYEEELMRGGFTRDFAYPLARADPDDRCAAMLIYGRQLAILPLAIPQSSEFLDEEGDNRPANLLSYIVSLCSIDDRLQNISDMCFLHGYYEPTLLFLYEPLQTTAGRASIRQDTFSILGVSLNTKDKVHAVVWQVSQLPLDCVHLEPVPKPVGGVMVVGANELIYLNQSVPAVGVAVNSCVDSSTRFPLRNHRHLHVTLDGPVCDFLSTTVLALAVRDGRLFLATLLVDNTNVVKDLHVELATDTSTPSTLTACTAGYLFVGSRLGDSQLLNYTESERATVQLTSCGGSRRADNSSITGEDLVDDMALYGEVVAATTTETVLVGRHEWICTDKLINIGPCETLCIGAPPPLSDVLSQDRSDPVFDLVATSGHAKDGAIVALQRTVRPQILTSSRIDGSVQTWTVGRHHLDSPHRYLVVSKVVTSMVLELAEEIAEMDASGFNTEDRTVAVGDLDDGRYIVQVSPMLVVLLQDSERVQELELEVNFPVSRASICNPYVCLLTEDDSLLLLHLVSVGSHGMMQLVQTDIHLSAATSICLYRDLSGLFVQSSGSIDHERRRKESASIIEHAKKTTIPGGDDEDDLLLYGELDQSWKFAAHPAPSSSTLSIDPPPSLFEKSLNSISCSSLSAVDPNTVDPTVWLSVGRRNGHLELYTLPSFQLVYLVHKFANCPELLVDTDPTLLTVEETRDVHSVRELLLFGFGFNSARLLLMAVVDDLVVIYETFSYDAGFDGHLSVRFRRLPYTIVTKPPDSITSASTPLLYPFEGVGTLRSGVFVAGSDPVWVLMDSGQVRLHRMSIDGPVRSFSPFHNVACPHGFLYLSGRSNDIRICRLSPDIDYDNSCPVRKLPLARTVHNVFYMLRSNCYVVVTSEQRSAKKLCVLIGDEKTFETYEKDAHFVYPLKNFYQLQLYSPDNWTPIANVGEPEFDEFELVTAAQEVLLKSEGTVSGFQNYLAVGTTFNYGEEVLVRGRIILSQVVDVVPEPGQPLTRLKIKPVYDKEQKGPVSSLCHCQGYLLTGMGQKVYIWLLRDNDLQGISFLDMHFYVHRLVGLRNLALAADLYRSVSLLRYQEQCKALSLVARDLRPVSQQAVPLGVQFVVDGRQLGFLMTDEQGNLSLFTYQPEAKESFGGRRLVLRADMHIGARVADIVRVKGHVGDRKVETEQRQVCLFITEDGAICSFVPVPEKVYRRLHMLQLCIGARFPLLGGLHPRAVRTARSARNSMLGGSSQQSSRNIVDGALVWPYLHLSSPDKMEIAKRLGTTKDQLIDDLVQLEQLITHF